MKKKIICTVSAILLVCTVMCSITALSMQQSSATAIPVSTQITNIEVDGLTKTYKFLQVTDLHITEIPDASSPYYAYSAAVNNSYTNEYGGGITMTDRIEYFFDYAEEEQVDAVIFTGDMISMALTENITAFETALADETIPYIFTVGNHDYTFTDHYFDDYANNTLRPMLSTIAQGNTNYNYIEYDDLIIAAIDDSQDKVVSTSTASFVRTTLAASTKPVLLAYHVPFYVDTLVGIATETWGTDVTIGPQRGTSYYDTKTKYVHNYIIGETTNVVATLCGHVHFNHEDTFANGVKQYCTGAGYEGNCRLLTLSPKATECTHTYDSGAITTAATAETDGVRTYTCTKCGDSYTEVIPKLGYIKGDFNGDDKTNALDLLNLKLYLTGKKSFTEGQLAAADVMSDGKVNALDLLRYKLYTVGKIKSF